MRTFQKNLLLIASIGISIISLISVSSCSSPNVLGGCLPSPSEDLYVNMFEINYNVTSDSIFLQGEIIDSSTYEQLPGANVYVTTKELKNVTSAVTFLDGIFRLGFKYDPDYYINFSYVGYYKKSYPLKDFVQQYFVR